MQGTIGTPPIPPFGQFLKKSVVRPKIKVVLGTVCRNCFLSRTNFEWSIWRQICIEEILWFQVTVDHSVGMQILQGKKAKEKAV